MTLKRNFTKSRAAPERHIRRPLRNPDDTADVLQEILLRVHAAELERATPFSEVSLLPAARNLAPSVPGQRTAGAADAPAAGRSLHARLQSPIQRES